MDIKQSTAMFQITEIGTGFSIDEAASLINHEVVKKHDQHKPITIENIGLISGLSMLNDQVEITITYIYHEEKATKADFEANFVRLT